MSKIAKIFVLVLLSVAVIQIYSSPKSVVAQNTFTNTNIQCSPQYQNYVKPPAIFPKQANLGEAFDITVEFNTTADSKLNYFIKLTKFGSQVGPFNSDNKDVRTLYSSIDTSTNKAIFKVAASGTGSNESAVGSFRVTLMADPGEKPICELGNINFVDQVLNAATCNIRMANNVKQDEQFQVNVEKNDIAGVNHRLYFFKNAFFNPSGLPVGVINVSRPSTLNFLSKVAALAPIPQIALPLGILSLSNQQKANFLFDTPVYAYTSSSPPNNTHAAIQVPSNTHSAEPPNLGWAQTIFDNSGSNRLEGGEYVAILEVQRQSGADEKRVSYCSYHTFKVSNKETDHPDDWTSGIPVTKPGQGGTIGGGEITSETCLQRAERDKNVKCSESGGTPCETGGIATAIGCIHTQPAALVRDVLKFLLGISGGIALLLMALGAFGMITSAGNPDNLQAGKDRFTQALIGLLFVIFSVLLLQLIGVDILGIEGFGR